MGSQITTWLAENYQLMLSIYTGIGIAATTWIGGMLFTLVPAIRRESAQNRETFLRKMQRAKYAENQLWNKKWGAVFIAVIFLGLLPFGLTAEAQPWWEILIDIFVILMVYDFFYYLTHKYLFHDNGFLGGPLLWVHSVHHRQHNPCRKDASYIHPIEVALGLGLYVATMLGLSLLMGKFHVVTIIVTWVAFSAINLHNHNLWENDRFPFRYLKYMSVMHHNHHAKFTGGNYATITLLFDWMFGTLDHGQGWGRNRTEEPVKLA